MLCLGLDTSCYTTSAALFSDTGAPVQSRQLLKVPAGECGLRQSEAVFAHIRQISEMVCNVTARASEPIRCVCASTAPRDGDDSYMPVFEVGAALGQSIAAALNAPFYKTCHQRGHIEAAKYQSGLADPCFLALHLSGGTTDLMQCDQSRITPLGTSLDLHAGQLVDRTGVMLGLPFPAGPCLEELAKRGTARQLLPVSMAKDGVSCHLSGAEAQIKRLWENGADQNDLAAEVYSLLCRTVLRMASAAAKMTGLNRILIAGGVASSPLLREMLLKRNEDRRLGLDIYFGRPEFSGDNAVGVAAIGLQKYKTELARRDPCG